MEYIVVTIASMLAGISTGLVGLSAATVMVPLLVVLCPSFQGPSGAYMATAIALSSDILGSAVTSFVYARNKNIDLRHGWIMLLCIVLMCMAGSIAAFFTHHEVLGGFSLLLCIGIGIRFLVKPDSKNKEPIPVEKKLSGKQIAVSIFFGLTIGFGTGFFGTGGGMMMLIVFTAFLGYSRNAAVGTSTFIMTFTALIASVCHILIEPAIILEVWHFLVIGIVVATAFSLISAQFANKVNGKIVGLVTGIILFVLGVAMTFINYIDLIPMAMLYEYLWVLGIFSLMIVVLASILILLRLFTPIPDYIFRKLLHIVAISTILPLTLCTNNWLIALLVDITFIVLVTLILIPLENIPFYKNLFVEKRSHEVLLSFLGLFIMIALFLALGWGVLGEKYLALASIMAWGPGDAMAAIVGKTLGKHKLQGKMIEGVKSVEGTCAMAITSFVCTLLTLLIATNIAWFIVLPMSIVIGVIASITELYTIRGWDTVTVPSVSFVILLILLIF